MTNLKNEVLKMVEEEKYLDLSRFFGILYRKLDKREKEGLISYLDFKELYDAQKNVENLIEQLIELERGICSSIQIEYGNFDEQLNRILRDLKKGIDAEYSEFISESILYVLDTLEYELEKLTNLLNQKGIIIEIITNDDNIKAMREERKLRNQYFKEEI